MLSNEDHQLQHRFSAMAQREKQTFLAGNQYVLVNGMHEQCNDWLLYEPAKQDDFGAPAMIHSSYDAYVNSHPEFAGKKNPEITDELVIVAMIHAGTLPVPLNNLIPITQKTYMSLVHRTKWDSTTRPQ